MIYTNAKIEEMWPEEARLYYIQYKIWVGGDGLDKIESTSQEIIEWCKSNLPGCKIEYQQIYRTQFEPDKIYVFVKTVTDAMALKLRWM